MSEVAEAPVESQVDTQPKVETNPTVKRIRDQAREAHEEFDKIWGEKSFHNWSHIEAVIEASDKMMEAAIDGDDPMNLQADLDKWNEENPNAEIDLEEFSVILRISIYEHDRGNLEGDKYTAAGAEERSKVVVAKAIAEDPDLIRDGKVNTYTKLSRHLIEQTKMIFDTDQLDKKNDVPFAKFMMTMDQIGNYFYRENKEEMVEGLIIEMATENPDGKVPDDFANFVRNRFTELVRDETTRKRILEIWDDQKIPDEVDPDPYEGVGLRELADRLRRNEENLTEVPTF